MKSELKYYLISQKLCNIISISIIFLIIKIINFSLFNYLSLFLLYLIYLVFIDKINFKYLKTPKMEKDNSENEYISCDYNIKGRSQSCVELSRPSIKQNVRSFKVNFQQDLDNNNNAIITTTNRIKSKNKKINIDIIPRKEEIIDYNDTYEIVKIKIDNKGYNLVNKGVKIDNINNVINNIKSISTAEVELEKEKELKKKKEEMEAAKTQKQKIPEVSKQTPKNIIPIINPITENVPKIIQNTKPITGSADEKSTEYMFSNRIELYEKYSNEYNAIKTDKECSRFRLEVLKQLGGASNKISASVSQVNMVIDEVRSILSKYRGKDETKYHYCIHFFVTRFFETLNEMSSEKAFIPNVYVIEGISIDDKEILQYTIGYLCNKCPYIIFKKPNEKIEVCKDNIPMSVKYMWIYFLFIITNPYKALKYNGLGIQEGWYWLSGYVNKFGNKELFLTPYFLSTFFEICGYEFHKIYKNYSLKLINIISTKIIPKYENSKDKGPLNRLNSMIKDCSFSPLEGLILKEKDSRNTIDGDD